MLRGLGVDVGNRGNRRTTGGDKGPILRSEQPGLRRLNKPVFGPLRDQADSLFGHPSCHGCGMTKTAGVTYLLGVVLCSC